MAPDPAEEEFLHPAEGVVAEDGNLVGAHVTGTERAATRGSKPSAAQANEGPEYHAVPLGDPWEHHEQTTTSQKEQQHTQEHYAENEDVSGEGEGDEQGPDPVGGVQHKVDLEKGPSHAEEEDSGQVPAPGGGVQHEVDLEKGPPHAEEEDSEQVPVPGGGVQHEVDHENKPSSAEATKATEDQRKEEARANLEAAVDKLDVEKTVEVDYDTTGLTTAQVEVLRQKYGWNEVKPHQDPEWIKVARRYLSLVPMLLVVAALFAVCVKEDGVRDWFSFALLIFLDNLMVWADYLGERSAHNAIKAVQKLGAPQCAVRRNGEWVQLEVRELVPGDIVSLKGGVIIPADGDFCTRNATITVDESALTGESLPIRKHPGAPLLSGSVVEKGIGEMRVTKIGRESFYGKTIALLARAERPGHLRTVLYRTEIFITGVAACFATFLFFWQSFHPDWKKIIPHDRYLIALKRAFILIASVIPAAMPVVTTTVLSVGALIITKQNAAVSRLSAIEEAAGVVILFSDKTGTLTKNHLSLFKEELCIEKGYDQATLLLYASLCSETLDPEPIDKTINDNADMTERAKYKIEEFTPFNPVDKRTEARVVAPDGREFLVAKGAPQVIRDMVCGPGDDEMRERLNELILEKAKRGLRTLGVAVKPISTNTANANSNPADGSTAGQQGGSWQLVGYICLFDPPREDTAETLHRARELGIRVIMITGDQRAIAVETARQLGLGTNIAGPEIWEEEKKSGTVHGQPFAAYIESVNGFAGVFPEHKFAIVDAMMDAHKLVAMTGDGVNDAPALKRATVGIAVSGATDAARAAADIVLFAPGLKTIITVISLSRQIFKRVESYIIFRIFTSLIILGMWWGSIVILRYQFPAWVLVLMSMINDFVLMSCSHDNVSTSATPMLWSMIRVIALSAWLGLLATVCILLYVVFADPSHQVNWWDRWNLSNFVQDWPLPVTNTPMSCQTNAGVWLLMTLLIQLCFQSVRTRGFFFIYNNENRPPAAIIIVPQICAVVITVFLVVYWRYHWRVASGPLVHSLNWGQAWVTIFWAFLWFMLMDLTKVLFYRCGWPALRSSKLFVKLDHLFCSAAVPSSQELQNRSAAHIAFDNMVAFLAKRQADLGKIEEKAQDALLYTTEDAVEKVVSGYRLKVKHSGDKPTREEGEQSGQKTSTKTLAKTAGGCLDSNDHSTRSDESHPEVQALSPAHAAAPAPGAAVAHRTHADSGGTPCIAVPNTAGISVAPADTPAAPATPLVSVA